MHSVCVCFIMFKQKTAYEVRISDWSSDVCSSDLHIAEQIEMIRTLEAGGHTFVIDDGVYFDVSTFPDYASFAGLNLDELTTTGRVEHVEAKRHPADFALWKLTQPGVSRQQDRKGGV